MKYKVHVAYIDSNGVIIHRGEYDESQIDISEAQRRSYVTPCESPANVVLEDKIPDTVNPKVVNAVKSVVSSDVKEVELSDNQESASVKALPINTADRATIVALKYVGGKTADKVLSERAIKVFSSYEDLDTRIKLPGNKKWVDVAKLSFDSSDEGIRSPLGYELSDTSTGNVVKVAKG